MSLQKIKRRDKLIKIKTHLLIVVNEKMAPIVFNWRHLAVE